jgi:hypothetical protein
MPSAGFFSPKGLVAGSKSPGCVENPLRDNGFGTGKQRNAVKMSPAKKICQRSPNRARGAEVRLGIGHPVSDH